MDKKTPRVYLRFVNTDLQDRESVLANFPDGDAVWEDLQRIRLWAAVQRRAESKGRRLKEDWQYRAEVTRRAYRRLILVGQSLPADELKRHLDDFGLETVSVQNSGNPVPLGADDFWSFLLRLQRGMRRIVERVAVGEHPDGRDAHFLEQVWNTVMCWMPFRFKGAASWIELVPMIRGPLPTGHSSLTQGLGKAISKLGDDLKEGVSYKCCAVCETRYFIPLTTLQVKCDACPTSKRVALWKKEHPKAVKKHRVDARKHGRNHAQHHQNREQEENEQKGRVARETLRPEG